MIRCEDMHHSDEGIEVRPVSKKWPRTLGWVCAVFVLMMSDILFVKGYYFGVGDQNFYLPQFKTELDPTLYPVSTNVITSTNKFSLFISLLALPVRLFGFEWTFFIAYVVATAAFYLACFLLAETLTGNRPAAYIFLLLMLPVTAVSETATVIWDPYLTQRGLAIPACLLGVYEILSRKHVLAYFLFGLAALIHPITAAAFAAACLGALAYDLWSGHITPRVVLLAGGALFAGAGLLLWKALTSTETGDASFFALTTPEWVAILQQRVPYMLPEVSLAWLWPWAAWFMLFFIAWFIKPVQTRQDAVIMGIVITCGALFILSLLVGSVIPFLPLARFEFARSLLIVILCARLYVAAALWRGLTSSFFFEKASAIVGGIAAVSLHNKFLSPSRLGVVVCILVFLQTFQRNIMSEKSRRVLSVGFIVLAAALLASELLTVFGFWKTVLFSPRSLGSAPAVALLMLSSVATLAGLKYLRSGTVIGLGGVMFCLAYASSVSPGGSGLKTVYFPGHFPITPWIQVQLWAREHTPKYAVFMVPWRRPSGFPIFSERGVVADWESGADAKFNYTFARQWEKQKKDLQNFDQLATADFCGLRAKYPFDNIVTKKPQTLQFPVVYSNTEFSVYEFSELACQAHAARRRDGSQTDSG